MKLADAVPADAGLLLLPPPGPGGLAGDLAAVFWGKLLGAGFTSAPSQLPDYVVDDFRGEFSFGHAGMIPGRLA
jgi:hypothetical protein